MPTQRKEASVAELTERLSAAKSLFFTDYQGLTVDEITRLRGELRKDGNTYAVVKNTLFRIAAGDLASQLEAYLAGPTGVVFAGADPVAPAKALKTFSDTVKKSGSKRRTSTVASSTPNSSKHSLNSRRRSNCSPRWSARSRIRCADS